MRWITLGLLVGCSQPPQMENDAGQEEKDAGRDAGPATAVMVYLDGNDLVGNCAKVEECSVSTPNDGGLLRWESFYSDAGCDIGEDKGIVYFDCRKLCFADAGNVAINATCCLHVRYTYQSMCGWGPP